MEVKIKIDIMDKSMKVSQNPVPLLSIYLKERDSKYKREIKIQVFIVALFAIANI